MKKQCKHVVLLSAATILLSACGGGSSGNAAHDHTVPAGNSNTGNSNATNHDNSNVANAMITGEYISIPYDDDISTGATDVHGDINTLAVKGRKIQISAPNVQSYTFTKMSDSNHERVISGNHMSYARYGAYWDKKGEVEYIFHQGKASESIPSAGIVNYEGYALYASEETSYTTANSRFTVDFGGTKSVKGTISGENIPKDVHLEAAIHGNGFSGTLAGMKTSGKFYGPNAAELSGTFMNEPEKIGGAFGAKRK